MVFTLTLIGTLTGVYMVSPSIISQSQPAKVLAFTFILLALPSAALAQEAPQAESDVRFYLGAAIEFIELNSFEGDSPNFFAETTETAVIRGGAVLHQYFAVEAEAALGISNESGDGIAEYDNRFAAHGRVRAPFGETGLEVFARLGYATTSIESRNVVGSNGRGSSNLDGVTYGGGVAYNFGTEDQFQVRIDYTEFNFGNDQDADSFSISLGYNF